MFQLHVGPWQGICDSEMNQKMFLPLKDRHLIEENRYRQQLHPQSRALGTVGACAVLPPRPLG